MSGALTALTDDPILLWLYDYWDGCRGGRPLPSRKDIDPVEIDSKVLPYLVLAEYVDEAATVRYRLVGTEMVRRFGMDFTGKRPDEIMRGSYLDFIADLFRDVRRHAAPVYSESIFRWNTGGRRLTRRLFLPLGDAAVHMVLIGQTYGAMGDASSEPMISILHQEHSMDELRREVLRVEP